MLRVGLTGDLGSGKSTVARMFAQRGAVVLSSDEMGRAMMQPGQAVYAAIVERFGKGVVAADGSLDRRELARLVFSEGRAEELNAIVHPAVIGEQARQIAELASTCPDAIVVVESALIFTTKHAPGGEPWSKRFDRVVLVTAPEAQKIARYVDRVAAGRELPSEERANLEADAKKRLAMQAANEEHAAECLVIRNDDGLEALEQQVKVVWSQLEQLRGEQTR
jgi:dephospho-CoA kinase